VHAGNDRPSKSNELGPNRPSSASSGARYQANTSENRAIKAITAAASSNALTVSHRPRGTAWVNASRQVPVSGAVTTVTLADQVAAHIGSGGRCGGRLAVPGVLVSQRRARGLRYLAAPAQ